MHYEDLRDLLSRALEDAELHAFSERPTETIDLPTGRRRWSNYVRAETPAADPFTVTASIAFAWGPLDAARSNTSDDDVVRELFGDWPDIPETQPRHQRIDFVLRASLPWGSKTPMPKEAVWQSWSASVIERLDPLVTHEAIESEEGDLIIMGWRGDVEIQSECREDGRLYLADVRVPSWQGIVLSPSREGDDASAIAATLDELHALADTYREAFDVWRVCVSDLRRLLDVRPNR